MHASEPASSRPEDALATRLRDRCLGLCAVPSVIGDEKRLADACWAWAQQSGIWPQEELVRHGNAMLLGQPDPSRPTVALVGHLDTVPPPDGTFAEPRVENGRVVALGSSDMKAGIAVSQQLCEDLAGKDLPVKPILVLYDREEGPYEENGLEPLLQASPQLKNVELAVVMEPTDNTMQLGCLGGLQATVRFVGQAAHSARPWEGSNAVHKAGPFLTHLLERGYEEVEVEGLLFRQVMGVTLASGGRARNMVPGAFDLNVNVRVAPVPGALEAAEAELRRLAVGAEVTITDRSPPGPVPTGNALLAHWQALCGFRVESQQAWTDVARLAAFGGDAVNYVPGLLAQAHQVGEYVQVADMVDSYHAVAKLLTTPLSS